MASISLFNAAASGTKVSKGVLKGVSVITEGEVLGHKCFADAKTLATVKQCADGFSGGLKVKLNHGSDAGDIVGTLNNFRIEGKQLKADLTLLQNSPHFDYLMELSNTMPDQFGLSIAFAPIFEKLDNKQFVRCTDIFSVDIVDSPAANPGGLFSQKMETETLENTEAKADEPKLDDGGDDAATGAAETVGVLNSLQALHDTSTAIIAEHKAKLEDQYSKIEEQGAKLAALEKLVAALQKTVDVQATEFATKLEAQKVEFSAEMKDANILAARKLAATGVPQKGLPGADSSSRVVSCIAELEAITDPLERSKFYASNKEQIFKEFNKLKK
jgi:hypothetical protein